MLLGPPHPAEVFIEEVWPQLGMDRKTLADHLGISVSTTSKFINRRARATPRIAAGLAAVSGQPPLYWLMIQARYDAWLIEFGPDQALRPALRAKARRFFAPA